MIRTTLNWTVKNLKTMFDEKNTLSFDHPIQRQSAQWDNMQQSLLIHPCRTIQYNGTRITECF